MGIFATVDARDLVRDKNGNLLENGGKMASTRSSSSRKQSATKKSAKSKQTFTAAQLRKAFPNAVKEIKVRIDAKDLQGTTKTVFKRLSAIAQKK